MKTCPKCSLSHDDSVIKCTYCGYDFVEEQSGNAQAAFNQPSGGENATNGFNQQNGNYQYNNAYNPYSAPQVKYCPRCGNQCDPRAVICVKCGAQFAPIQPVYDDHPTVGMKILSFFVPLVGLILYITDKDKRPVSAKAYGKTALIGFCVSLVLSILFSLIIPLIFGIAIFSDPNIGYSYNYSYEMLLSLSRFLSQFR